MFTLYKILKACIMSVNMQIIKWDNKVPGSKSLPPPPQKLPPGPWPIWPLWVSRPC